LWWITRDGDRTCLALYERHYSAEKSRSTRDARGAKLFVGPGESVVLRTRDGDALFVWRRFIDDSGQLGVNCAVFRNEGPALSSLLVRQADAIADHVWPGQRHYTYVNPSKVRGSNPGYCFLAAGWRRCRGGDGRIKVTQRGLHILERA
jgi:hypothetical protein